MRLNHFDRIPQSVRREPIMARSGGTFSFRDACAGGVAMAILAACVIAAGMILATRAQGREGPQWAQMATPDNVSKRYRDLMMPDAPAMSCCGAADAYHADSFEIQGDQYVAIITDERPDGPLGRPHIKPGTKILVPNQKLKFDAGNPTGHGVIFVRRDSDDDGYWRVLCYIVPGGV